MSYAPYRTVYDDVVPLAADSARQKGALSRPAAMFTTLMHQRAAAAQPARVALVRPRRCLAAAPRSLRHVAHAAASGYVNPLRPGETEAQAAERRQRESARVDERTKVRALAPRPVATCTAARRRACGSAAGAPGTPPRIGSRARATRRRAAVHVRRGQDPISTTAFPIPCSQGPGLRAQPSPARSAPRLSLWY